MRYFIEISYNGTNYHGWQKQLNANSVQEELTKCLSVLLQEEVEIIGSGRTDSGVHAEQIFAHFDTEKSIDSEKLVCICLVLLLVELNIKTNLVKSHSQVFQQKNWNF